MKFINNEKFFNEFRPLYKKWSGQALTTQAVRAIEYLLAEFEKQTVIKRIDQISYCFATTGHETAWTFEPIEERGGRAYFVRLYWTNQRKARELGNLSAQDAVDFNGKGDVQLTGRNNYRRATKEIRKQLPSLVAEFEQRTGEKFDLEANPHQAKDWQIAFAVMILGMSQGWFTGKKLADYFNSKTKDARNARRIINGTDKAATIAKYSEGFELCLKAALEKESAQTTEQTEQPEFTEGEKPVEVQTELTKPQEQNANESAPVQEPASYNNIGFWATIKRDLMWVTGGNVTIQSAAEYGQQAQTVVPPSLLTKLAYFALAASIAYLVFRLVHFLVDRWQQKERTRLEADAQTAIDRKNIEWVKPPQPEKAHGWMDAILPVKKAPPSVVETEEE